MHTLYKSVDKNKFQTFPNITGVKQGVNPVRNILRKYSIVSNGVNKKLDRQGNMCYNSQKSRKSLS